MRIGEFSQIKINQLDFENNLIEIPAEVTKTKKRRVVRVNPELMLDVKDYIISNNIKSGYLFSNSRRNPYSIRTYERLFEKYFDKYELKEKLNLDFSPRPHSNRHLHIIVALQSGVPINAIMQNVGHKSIKTTQIYARLSASDVSKAYKDVEI